MHYRPTALDMIEGHQAKLDALIGAVADIPPDRLEIAARRWIQSNRFMPSAAELIDLARPAHGSGGVVRDSAEHLDALALHANQSRDPSSVARGIIWVRRGKDLVLTTEADDYEHRQRIRETIAERHAAQTTGAHHGE